MALTINTNIKNDADGYLLDAKNVKGGYIVVANYSELANLPSACVVEGMLAYCQVYYADLDKEAGFYQYKNNTWNYVKLENLEQVKISITGDFDPTQTFTFTIDNYNLFSLIQGASLEISFTGGGISLFHPDFFQISQTEFTSSAVVVLNGTQYIATINFDLSSQSNNATLSFQEIEGGGSGSGKLYELNMEITLYDDNGDPVPSGSLGVYSTNPINLSMQIYESNWESVKEKANENISAVNNATQASIPLLTDVNSLVSFLNTYINETVADGDTIGAIFILLLSNIVDKSFLTATAGILKKRNEVFGSDFGFILPSGANNSFFELSFNDGNDDVYYALNLNNSCTLTEYGTSGSGGGSGTSPVLYKHSMELVAVDGESNSDTYTFEFLSKYATPFVTNGSLADMLTYYASLQDTTAIISPMVRTNNLNFIISQIRPISSGVSICIVNTLTVVLQALYTDNASGITDTVTTYIETTGGGSGSGEVATKKWYEYKLTEGSSSLITHSYIVAKISEEQQNELFTQLSTALSQTISTPQDLIDIYNQLKADDLSNSQTIYQQLVQVWMMLWIYSAQEFRTIYTSAGFGKIPVNLLDISSTFQDTASGNPDGDKITFDANSILSITETTETLSGSSSPSQPSIPERFSIADNLVVNINQEQFANGSWTGTNNDNIRTFQYNGVNADEEKARELVEFLTGVNVLDEYNATKPTPCFVFTTQANICWKLQWDSTVLHAYKVENFPFVVKEKYYKIQLRDYDSDNNTATLLMIIPYETMQEVYNEINQTLGSNISTPQEVIAVYDSLKADSIQNQPFSMLCLLFMGLAQSCLYSNLSNIIDINNGDTYKISGVALLAGGVLYNGNTAIFSQNLTSNRISFTSNSSLTITEKDKDSLY